ncbi:MAG: hypothetical protein ACQEUZ_05695 [Pseudomonadota bacterium]
MSRNKDDSRGGEPPERDPKAEREARLAEALRANLRRRKARARAAKEGGREEGGGD